MKKVKFKLTTVFLFLWITGVLSSQPSNYGTGNWDRNKYGNHRVVLKVTTSQNAVYAHIPWRRRDDHPEKKGFILMDGQTGKEIHNFLRLKINREFGEIVFQPVSGPGLYYLYYLPYKISGRSNYPTVHYLLPENRADPLWVKSNQLEEKALRKSRLNKLPTAFVKQFQAVDSFNSFFPMEVIATQKEVKEMMAKHHEAFLLFAESRKFPIRMRHDLPFRWIKKGPSITFSDTLYQNEYYAFQIGLFAARDTLSDVDITFSGLFNGSGIMVLGPQAFTCFNKTGVSWNAKSFSKTLPVPLGSVQPLWIGVDIPKNMTPGAYDGEVTVTPNGENPQKVKVHFSIKGTVLEDRGDSASWRHSKLRWLNSLQAVDEEIVKPFTPMEVDGDTISVLGRKIVLESTGLPKQVISYFNGSNTSITSVLHPLLSDGFRLMVTYPGEIYDTLIPEGMTFTHTSGGLVQWVARNQLGEQSMILSGKMEFDGFIELKMLISSQKEIRVEDISLEIPVDPLSATYFMGLGHKGGKFPGQIDWKWNREKNQDGAWIGNINGGFQFSLRGANYDRPLNTNFYHSKPLNMPISWDNLGKGGISITPKQQRVVIRAYSGNRTLHPGDTLCYQVNLLLTPFKPIETQNHWKNRYYHSFQPVDSILKTGANVINVHHATPINPYINYPFLRQDTMKKYIAEAHKKNVKVKIYNTIRELSNAAPEIFAIRSLNHEIFSHGPGNGYSWLQEHLVDDYIAAWFVPKLRDAAIINSGMSRWHNYYVEGLNWLAKNMKIDGIYIDDIAFDRTTMKRVRKVLDRNRPNALIDLHSANQYNPRDGFINSANLYMEHFPYLNRLWFGEYFDKNSPADFYLLEMSGIPFGLMGEMLQDGGNPWRGMIFGMTARLPWAGDPRPIWQFWDKTHIEDTRMIGYWDRECPIKSGNDSIKVTVYLRDSMAIVALASWASLDTTVSLEIDWETLGMNKENAVIEAPEINNFQNKMTFDHPEIPVEKGKGWLLMIYEKR